MCEAFGIDDTLAEKQSMALVDKPRKAALALRTREVRRLVEDDRRSSLYGFLGRRKTCEEVLGYAMYLVYCVYSADVRDLVEPHEASSEERLAESVKFLLSDPP